MILYKELNRYLDDIELPKTIEEVLSYKHELEADEFRFLDSANKFLKEHEDYSTYKEKEAHCIGTCLTDFTRVGVYFLLEDEIVTVNTSNLNREAFNWKVFHFPFSKIDDLDLVVEEGMDCPNNWISMKWTSGSLLQLLPGGIISRESHWIIKLRWKYL